ncbi:MAG: hypothetical protein KC561_18370, partial [Myxococcales bacterium]|nr:hypothetical protein [Myxococcales bacterium]
MSKSTSLLRMAALGVVILSVSACDTDQAPPPRYRTTIDELLLENARTCNSGFLYPQELIDGIGVQLVEELICMDDSWLEFYEPCEEVGCIWAHGPQPLAIRPEVIQALREVALEENDFISITAGYRDVAMQYYSRWYKENCNSDFAAAIPGGSNHQGGRAVDIRYPAFWNDALLAGGFVHPIPNDTPHYELYMDATFREESEDLKELSILAFQRLWNRNNPNDLIPEDGVYGADTKEALGSSPVEGFPIGAICSPVGEGDPDEDMGGEVLQDVSEGPADLHSQSDTGEGMEDSSAPDPEVQGEVFGGGDQSVGSDSSLASDAPSGFDSVSTEDPDVEVGASVPSERFATVGQQGLVESGCAQTG